MLGSSEQMAHEETEEKPSGDWAVGVLTGDTFSHGIEKGLTFVKFFAPWCGHCKRLAPTWEELGRKFLGKNGVNIMKVDCTLEINKQLCSEQEVHKFLARLLWLSWFWFKVEGFPSIFLYRNGEKLSEYTGNRGLDDLYEFVVKHKQHDEL